MMGIALVGLLFSLPASPYNVACPQGKTVLLRNQQFLDAQSITTLFSIHQQEFLELQGNWRLHRVEIGNLSTWPFDSLLPIPEPEYQRRLFTYHIIEFTGNRFSVRCSGPSSTIGTGIFEIRKKDHGWNDLELGYEGSNKITRPT